MSDKTGASELDPPEPIRAIIAILWVTIIIFAVGPLLIVGICIWLCSAAKRLLERLELPRLGVSGSINKISIWMCYRANKILAWFD